MTLFAFPDAYTSTLVAVSALGVAQLGPATEWLAGGGKEIIDWLILRVMAPFGAATPAEQTATSFVLAFVMWSSSLITLGLSIIAAVVFTGTFLWGVYRIITEGPMAGGWKGSVQNTGGTV